MQYDPCAIVSEPEVGKMLPSEQRVESGLDKAFACAARVVAKDSLCPQIELCRRHCNKSCISVGTLWHGLVN
jgi:hypothetical protein